MLKIGYGLTLLAGGLLVGYLGYLLVRFLLAAQFIGPFFKAVILLGALGVLMTLAGLIRERRKESKDADDDDGDD
jgi:hypothetical protein